MSKTEQVQLKKGKSYFNLVGKVKIFKNTFKMHEVSQTGFKYSRINLGIETSLGNVVFCEAMGGYSTIKDNVVYVSAKEDMKNTYTIDWEDRHDESVLASIHENKFIKIGVEEYGEDDNKKTLVKKFLSWYDAIDYLQDNLKDNMTLNVNGMLKYSMYQGRVQVKKEIQSIYLSKAEPENYKASFIQTVLLANDCVSRLDKETNEYTVATKVLDYNKELKTTIPYFMEYIISNENPESTNKFIDMFFNVKKGITEFAVEGDILEGSPLSKITKDEIPDNMRELIDIGLYTEEEIIGKMVVKEASVSKFIIKRPFVQMKEFEDGTKKPQTFHVENRYSEDDLLLECMMENEEEKTTDNPEDDSWLNKLSD